MRRSLVDQAYQEIRKRILDNYYAPGHNVLELELAADLGMSRTPVREALVRLQNEGFVQLIPRHGMRVVPLSVHDLREMYEVLTSLSLVPLQLPSYCCEGTRKLTPSSNHLCPPKRVKPLASPTRS